VAFKVFKSGKALFLKNGVTYCKQNPGLKLAHNKNIQYEIRNKKCRS
jgi:hypothetical protein